MRMSNYKQYNTKWAKLPYPTAPHYIKECGCGEVAIANAINASYKNKGETPKSILPYCKQFAAPNGDGTYWSAPPTMMKHYGMTEVKEHADMASLWKELAKGDRVAIYLMSNRLAGSNGVKWTGSKHFVCSTNYRKNDSKHEVYMKDSNTTSELRNGWISYEDNMRNAVFKVWSGKLPIAPQDKMCSWAKKIAEENYHYVNYSTGKKAHECPICHDHPKGKYYGWNCIGFAFATWRHGAKIKCRCSCDAMTDQLYEKALKASKEQRLKIVQDRLGIKDIKVLKSGSGIDTSKLKMGDIVVYFNGNNYVHTALWVGNGKIADCTSSRKDGIKYGVKSYTKWKIKLAIRYTGK